MYDTLQLYVCDIASAVYLLPSMTRRSTVIDLISQATAKPEYSHEFPYRFFLFYWIKFDILKRAQQLQLFTLGLQGNKT